MTSFNEAYEVHEPKTGGYIEVETALKQSISGFVRNSNRFYIGKTSGKNGLRARWNSKYKDDRMKHIAKIYTTTSIDFANNLESSLIQYYQNDPRLMNEVGGGGGDIGVSPFIIYIAWD